MSTTPRGSTTGLTDWFYYHQESPALETNEDRDLFGYALSAGDYNGDGKDDLAVGAPGEVRSGVREGVVYLLAGGASGMTAMGEVKQGALSTAHPEERFGSALASGDLNRWRELDARSRALKAVVAPPAPK